MLNLCKKLNLWLPTIVLLIEFRIGQGVYTHLLTELGSHMYNTCIDEKCDRNVNEQLIQITESYMNKSADPCEDFFDYACGNWQNISELQSTFQYQENIFQHLLVKLMEELELRLEKNELNDAYTKALYYYKSCLQWKKNTFGLREFLTFVEPAAAQEWPIYVNRTSLPWNFEHFVWWKVLAKLQSYDFKGALIEIDIDAHELDGKLYTINIAEPEISEKIFLSKRMLKAMGNYTKLQQNLLKWKLHRFEEKLDELLDQIFVDETNDKPHKVGKKEELLKNAGSELKELVKNIFDNDMPEEKGIEIIFNLILAHKNNTLTSESDVELLDKIRAFKPSRASADTYLSLTDLQSKLPAINWQQYFDIALHGMPIAPNAKIFTVTNVKLLQRLITFYNESSKETLALYMLASFLEYLESNMPLNNKNTTCIQALHSQMPLAIAYLYEVYYYGAVRNESDFVINDLLMRLKAKLNATFEDSEIDLSQKEVEFLKHKVAKMSLNIGNLPANITVEFLVAQYAPVNITSANNFYHNHLELLRNKRLLAYRLLNATQSNSSSPYDTFDLLNWTTDISPYYQPWLNRIILPFSYLRMPLYHHKLHDVFLFSELGWSLGHEMMHGFDSNGLLYNADGNFDAIGQHIIRKESFSKKIKCLSEQETVSIDERIADISGLHLVIKTFLNDRTAKTSQFHTHSTQLSNRQLFFVKLSHFFCVSDNYNTSDTHHDLSDVRVVYSMANTREFAHEFKCEQESAMKPKSTCSLW